MGCNVDVKVVIGVVLPRSLFFKEITPATKSCPHYPWYHGGNFCSTCGSPKGTFPELEALPPEAFELGDWADPYGERWLHRYGEDPKGDYAHARLIGLALFDGEVFPKYRPPQEVHWEEIDLLKLEVENYLASLGLFSHVGDICLHVVSNISC